MSSHGGRGEGALWGLFCKGIDPIHEALCEELGMQQLPGHHNELRGGSPRKTLTEFMECDKGGVWESRPKV